MSWIRKRLAAVQGDRGISLVEVVVALMVFSVIALGVGYSALTILKMTDDSRSRQVASNLATSELDLARAAEDPFDIVNGTRVIKVGVTNYTIVRSTAWVDTAGSDVGCGTGTGTLQSKRVNVTVTWDAMLTTTDPVRSDTLISPDERINDPSLGTIRVSVLTAAGTGSSGVAVTITPTSGGKALDVQPDATDTDGCSYALKVAPGTYKVAIARSNSVDTDQVASPFKSVVVTAGGSVAALFQYDYAATFTINYASNNTGTAAKLPTDLDVTYVSTYGLDYDTGRKAQAVLHPVPSGYTGIAGKYVIPVAAQSPNPAVPGCLNVDPAQWKAGSVSGTAYLAGVRPDPVAAAPAGTATMSIPMGVLSVKSTSSLFLYATSTTASGGSGDPGCSLAPTYSFGQVLTNGTIVIALPYGTWTLYSSTTSSGARTAISQSNLGTVGSILSILGSGNSITLDPRKPA